MVVLLLISLGCLIVLLLISLGCLIGFFFSSVRGLVSPFECGFDAQWLGRAFFSVRISYFILLFLVFDVELSWFLGVPVWGLTLFPVGIFLLVFVWLGFLLEKDSMIWDV